MENKKNFAPFDNLPPWREFLCSDHPADGSDEVAAVLLNEKTAHGFFVGYVITSPLFCFVNSEASTQCHREVTNSMPCFALCLEKAK